MTELKRILDQILLAASHSGVPMPNESSSYLEPEGSRFSPRQSTAIRSYELLVVETLLEPTECEVQSLVAPWQLEESASVVCLPSFEPEWVLRVVGDRKAKFWVVLLEAETNIWYSALSQSETSPSPPVKKLWAELAKEIGGAVCDVWSDVVSQTRYPRTRLAGGCDGATHHFEYSGKGVPAIAGKTWSPVETTIPGRLAGLARCLRDYVRDQENQDAFLQAVNDHLLWLQSHKPMSP